MTDSPNTFSLSQVLREAVGDSYRVCDVDGVRVERLTEGEVLSVVRHRLGAGSGPMLAILSVNVDHLHRFSPGSGGLLRPVKESGVVWLSLADGAPVAVTCQRVAKVTWPRVTGADLLPGVLAEAQTLGARVGVLGGSDEMHQEFDAALTEQYPGLPERWYDAPSRAEVESREGGEAMARRAREAGVDVLCVSLGKPRQELWLEHHGAESGAAVGLAFGAAADFLAGRVRRAPEWVQNAGLEWGFRLVNEPTRLARRYLVDGPTAMPRLTRTREISLERGAEGA